MFFSYKMPFSAVFWSVLSAASGQFSKKLLNVEYSNKALENVFKASIWLVVASLELLKVQTVLLRISYYFIIKQTHKTRYGLEIITNQCIRR